MSSTALRLDSSDDFMGEHSDSRVMEDPGIVSHNEDGFEMTIGSNGSAFRMEGTTNGELGLEDTCTDGEARYASGTSSAAGAVANFLNSIVGAGIVGLPYALAQVRLHVSVSVCLCLGKVWKWRVFVTVLPVLMVEQNQPGEVCTLQRNIVRNGMITYER